MRTGNIVRDSVIRASTGKVIVASQVSGYGSGNIYNDGSTACHTGDCHSVRGSVDWSDRCRGRSSCATEGYIASGKASHRLAKDRGEVDR